MTSLVVFDYGFGNVRSMVRALENVASGARVELTRDRSAALEADGLVVPGVGAFAACMDGLESAGGADIIYERVHADRPVLGVCVGEQIMFNSGSERGIHRDGLGLFGGHVGMLSAPVVPHMGWNSVSSASGSVLFSGLESERFYYVHSYAAPDVNESAMREDVFSGAYEACVTYGSYGGDSFVAAVEKGPLMATQFHPEKSGEAGAGLLRNWIRSFS